MASWQDVTALCAPKYLLCFANAQQLTCSNGQIHALSTFFRLNAADAHAHGTYTLTGGVWIPSYNTTGELPYSTGLATCGSALDGGTGTYGVFGFPMLAYNGPALINPTEIRLTYVMANTVDDVYDTATHVQMDEFLDDHAFSGFAGALSGPWTVGQVLTIASAYVANDTTPSVSIVNALANIFAFQSFQVDPDVFFPKGLTPLSIRKVEVKSDSLFDFWTELVGTEERLP